MYHKVRDAPNWMRSSNWKWIQEKYIWFTFLQDLRHFASFIWLVTAQIHKPTGECGTFMVCVAARHVQPKFNLAFCSLCKLQAQYLPKIFHYVLLFFVRLCDSTTTRPYNNQHEIVSLNYISCGKTLYRRQISSAPCSTRCVSRTTTKKKKRRFPREAKIK